VKVFRTEQETQRAGKNREGLTNMIYIKNHLGDEYRSPAVSLLEIVRNNINTYLQNHMAKTKYATMSRLTEWSKATKFCHTCGSKGFTSKTCRRQKKLDEQ
jgi:NADH pyrophosphatase NudC (nudix superfamily)